MKIRRKLLLSYLLIVALFIAAGATVTVNTMKMSELQTTVKQQVEINNNAYAYQQGLDQKQFGTLMYSSDNVAQGEQIIVKSANTMQPAETYLLEALKNNPELLSKFNEVVDIDRNQINGAITQVYIIYGGSDPAKYESMWNQLTSLMNAVTQADLKLAEVRTTTLSNVDKATLESQNYANFSNIINITFLVVVSVVAVAMAFVLGKRITDPLKKLSEIAHKVSLGDLNQRHYLKQNIDIKTGDEIDELVDAFRRMINAFRMTEALSKEPEVAKD
jgi:nitrogen fixation/metabolism regulation signal transduction histidine kinase